MSKWEVVMFCCVGSSCEGVDSNQCWPLRYKLCMNIDDVYFDKSEIYIDIHVKKTFVLILMVQV